ncbi:ATP-grasp domain-containing protein [Deinococcus radiophilus]|uniref:ATP-grasp domain-containing protein n=1 Tax=Deinococcus radiophilus TaxID=32062 RepID=UPI003609AAE8
MSLAAARELFSAPQFPPMLLMEVLEGPERSVDCVAWEGRLIRAVVRRKFGVGQVIEDRPDLTEAARRIAERYGLSGIFNFQTKDQAGAANMLEINARASGACATPWPLGSIFCGWDWTPPPAALTGTPCPRYRLGFRSMRTRPCGWCRGCPPGLKRACTPPAEAAHDPRNCHRRPTQWHADAGH